MPNAAAANRGDVIAEVNAEVVEPVVVETTEPETKVDETKVDEAKVDETKVDDPKPKADGERDDKGRFIPLNRHEKVLNAERTARETAERELAELRATMKKVDSNADIEKIESEIQALELEREAALLDGNKEKAAGLSKDIRMKERVINEVATTHKSGQAESAAVERVRFDMAVDKLEELYPVLKSDNENFDQEIVDDILDLQKVYMGRYKLSSSEAIVKAAGKVLGGAKPAEVEPVGLAKGKEVAADRKQAAVAKNVDAAARQPASTKDVGINSDKDGVTGKVDVNTLTGEEYAALPAATKARLRGDSV